jgi:iron complex outermembrane receptor protein
LKNILFSLFVLFPLSFLQAQSCLWKLSGHVHSASAHENLSNATVRLAERNKLLMTNENGDFVFDSLCAGTYTLQISHASYDTLTRMVTLAANMHADIDMVPLKGLLAEVTVTTARAQQITGIRKELSARDLEQTKGFSLAEALSRVTGVAMLQTGATISKPVIHGLHGNRILTINNGVRQEGQQWGNEHAPEIDLFIAGRLTVIKGVDELRYGSDAIGGVILVEPKALRILPGYNAEFNAGYFTNNRQYIASGVWEQQLKKMPSLTYRVQATLKKAANAAAPQYRLNNTASEEKNVSLTLVRRTEHLSAELFYSYFHTKLGIFTGAHIGNLTDLAKAIEATRPDPVFTGQNTYKMARPYQDVTHHLLKWRSVLQAGSHKIGLQLAAQYNAREEFDIVRSSTNKRPQIDLNILTLTEDLTWEHQKKKFFSGVLGISAMQQDNSYAGRYFVPNYRSYTYGGYYIEKWSRNKWEAQAGVRYDHKNIYTNRLLTGGTVFDRYDFSFSTFGSSFNIGYKPAPQWNINSNIALSSRAPHVNELLSNGIHHGTATYEQGDITLRPERSVNLSLNSRYHNKKGTVHFDFSVYRNRINRFIYQQPIPGEPVLTIAGAFPKLVYRQTDAVLQGLDVSSVIKPAAQVEWMARYSLLRARNTTADDWLIRMPADRISNVWTYNFRNGKRITDAYFSLELQNVFRQSRVPDEKNAKQDYKAPPKGYTLLNGDVSASFRMGKLPATVGLSGRNLLNRSYRDYLNNLRYFTDEVGRNIGLRLKITLQKTD